MLFNSLQYLVFLPIVVGLYWLADRRLRPLLLLFASYYFYTSWFAQYGLLLAFLTLVNFQLGLIIANKTLSQLQKRSAFATGLFVNLSSLIFFKYTDFLISSCWQSLGYLSNALGRHGSAQPAPQLQILLPLGISFFVFEFIHYLFDIRQGNKPIEDPVRFGLFASFFPSQIAGPIKRYEDFDAQIDTNKQFDPQLFQAGLWLILEGLFKKIVLGDNFAIIVQQGFGHTKDLAGIDAWVCTVAFALQIYYDFSGYTDVGRGSAMLLGFRLPENFNKPYLASELIDFWRRWHISLSTWLRDYLYKPLGGSKYGSLRKYRNLIVTMLLGGLWHGASWHFVLWGAFHGVGLSINHAWRAICTRFVQETAFSRTWLGLTFGRVGTILFILLTWVLFRANSINQAREMYRRMFSLHVLNQHYGSCTEALTTSVIPISLAAYCCFQLIKYALANRRLWLRQREQPQPLGWQWWLSPPPFTRAFGYLAWAIVTLALCASKSNPFIYFQF
jgi:alginate O-acetyltransferase complex protein AlgI